MVENGSKQRKSPQSANDQVFDAKPMTRDLMADQ